MKYGADRLAVPVAVIRLPFQVRIVLLADMPERSRPIVPAPVMVPPVRPLLVAIEVTVPVLDVRQTPPTATQPPYGRLMPAIVDVAVVEADVNESGPAKDEVAVPETVSVPVAVRLAIDTLPENRPLPWTERAKFVEGVLVPRPKEPVDLTVKKSPFIPVGDPISNRLPVPLALLKCRTAADGNPEPTKNWELPPCPTVNTLAPTDESYAFIKYGTPLLFIFTLLKKVATPVVVAPPDTVRPPASVPLPMVEEAEAVIPPLNALSPPTVRVPVAVRLAIDTLPENRPLPWTERAKSDDGEVVPIPTLPPNVPKYAEPVDVRAVVEAYAN